jgi:hypothetical protein
MKVLFFSYALDLDTSRSCIERALDERRKGARTGILEWPGVTVRHTRNPVREFGHVDISKEVPESATRLVAVGVAWAWYLGTEPVWHGLDERPWDVISDFDRNAVPRIINSRLAQPRESVVHRTRRLVKGKNKGTW